MSEWVSESVLGNLFIFIIVQRTHEWMAKSEDACVMRVYGKLGAGLWLWLSLWLWFECTARWGLW